ncbi:MAG: SDR family NAD(P)-dependent oxidoreductase [Desulfobacterales bacterium]|jgi:3-oxoacyl-[acyl-carrier protein] reductase|nr:beta-ketoacyl-ACP reductase [Desulfobacter sp.]MDP6683930.1 SDR family NAD(P)-dependent oxidoreductase [Desulfobacterales bacterium]MDP6808657.1 SDR family NAD(P)-dependent oxidoreductase [Desulfobacterales bacterium]|tara:strand:+ start:8107 stop:8928 length:822 start_codon:yes stop_codon:yes gene_type:complete
MGNVIIITGSGSGIGRTIALRFAKAGYRVVINDIVKENGEKILAEIISQGGQGIFVPADVSNIEQVRNLFQTTLAEYGQVDVLVNNAGVPGGFSFITDMPDETWLKTISVHLTGTFFCIREALKTMIKMETGRIINIASIAGLMGTVGSGEYGAAKAGIINLTKTCAKESGPFNITVNAIAPGMVGTPTNLKLQKKRSQFIETAIEGTPTGCMTTPAQISETCFFLASKSASNITGQVVTIDGGAEMSTNMDSFMAQHLIRRNKSASNNNHGK